MKPYKIIRWLENTGYNLINDDNGHWACVINGMQTVPLTDEPAAVSTSFFIEADEWKDSIAEAVEHAMQRE